MPSAFFICNSEPASSSLSFHQAISQQIGNVIKRHGLTEKTTLHLIATLFLEQGKRVFSLFALCHTPKIETVTL